MTSTETLTTGNPLALNSPSMQVKYEPLVELAEEQAPVPVRPMSSRPARSSRRASFAEDQQSQPLSQSTKSRPKTSHVSGGGRRRWGGSPPPHPKVEESQEEDLQSHNRAPDSPTLRPMTNIYRYHIKSNFACIKYSWHEKKIREIEKNIYNYFSWYLIFYKYLPAALSKRVSKKCEIFDHRKVTKRNF